MSQVVQLPGQGVGIVAQPPRPAAAADGSLKARTIRGSLWTIGGYGGAQVLRVASSVVLSRLLFPEAFGLMSLVAVFMAGLQMFSDVGIGPSIIQHRRGEHPTFLNTAWTIQVFRGLGLWGCSCLLAWPVAAFYHQSMLRWLIPIAGMNALLSGFNSTSLFTLNRRLEMGRLTVLTLATQAAGLVVTVIWAMLHRSVWALVAGGLATSLLRMALSHWALPGTRNRFCFDRQAREELFSFGKWIFISTLLTFCALQADRIIFGKVTPLSVFGVYSMAVTLAQMPVQAISSLSNVLFPAFSRAKAMGKDLPRTYERVAMISCILGGAPIAVLIAAGPSLVQLMYDHRYAAAGSMVQLVAIGTWFRVLQLSNGSALLALGSPRWIAVGNLLKLAGMMIVIPLGYMLYGFHGAIVAVAATDLVKYAASEVGIRRYGLSALGKDAVLTACLAVASVAGWMAAPSWSHGVLRLGIESGVAMLLWSPLIWRASRLLKSAR